MKIVINRALGVFQLSKEAYEFLGIEWDGYGFAIGTNYEKDRTNPKLVECIEKLGDKAGCLEVVEIPDDVDWGIFDYDGIEYVYDKNRFWPKEECED